MPNDTHLAPTITDHYARTAKKMRISVTDRCAMRCSYCMPADQPVEFMQRDALLSFEEITRIAKVARDYGIEAFRLTGGEPLARKNIAELVNMINNVVGDARLAMTTNAIGLYKQAQNLRDAGLQGLTFSLDTLQIERMELITGGKFYQSVMAGIHAASEAQFSQLRMNTVVVRGLNDEEICELAEFAWSLDAEPRFIEYMPFDKRWDNEKVVTEKDIVEIMAKKFGAITATPRDLGETAARYSLGSGQVFGVIPTVSRPLCSECDRLRITADGRVLGCLFATDGPGLKSLLRTDGCTDKAIAEKLRLCYQDRGAGYLQEALQSAGDSIKYEAVMHKVGG